tara:strand:+ start:2301 stop:2510 length:210 start_codon:yes stop_codon:yes gene_type:complete
MYVIVLILIQMGQHKIASDQILYSSMERCEIARSILIKKLEDSKPSKESFSFSKCTKISFEEDKTKVTL